MANPSFTLKIQGLDSLISDFKKAGVNYRPLMTQAMQKSTNRLKNDIQSNITNEGISNTGNLRRSIYVKKASDSEGIVAVGEKYGAYVEFGTRPHFPPIAPLERWAKTKLGKDGLGFLIARKIARKGTKAQPYVEPAYRADAQFVIDQFATAVGIILKQMAGK